MNFQPTQVNPQGLTTLIRNLGRDCPPSQHLREFLKNSVEACQRTGQLQAKISIDFNSAIYAVNGFYKIAFTDNGDGMSPEQMLSLLNNLSSSGYSTNEHQNYGVGAKISAMTRNHLGIQYESWKDNVGYRVLICYQPEEDIFGIQGFMNAEGQSIYAVPLSEDDKPDMIESHGTRVTLFGMSESQDTMTPPYGMSGGRDAWIHHYLDNRFFRLPANINISARHGYYHPFDETDKNHLKLVTGFKVIADQHAEFKGQTRLSNANVYWWILPEGCPIKGHTALLNQDEIFDVSDARSNRISHFGIVVGRDRVMIYVEPDEAQQNTSRTNLVKPDGSQLNWNVWQDEFRQNQPQEIRDFIDRMLNETAQVSHTNTILKRLRALKALFLLSGYQEMAIKRKFKLEPTVEETPLLASPIPSEETLLDEELPKDASIPTQPESIPPVQETPKESEAPEVNLFPMVEWTNEARSPQLAGRAAEYVGHENLVLANRDFKGFKDLVQYFLNKYAGTENIEAFVVSATNEVIEQALMESVAGVLSLKGQPHWHDHAFHLALLPEALTTGMMQRYWLASYVDQKIRQELFKT
jgi:hypothetical protein